MYNNAFFRCIMMKTQKNNYEYVILMFFFRIFIIMYLKMHSLDVLFSHFRSHMKIIKMAFN